MALAWAASMLANCCGDRIELVLEDVIDITIDYKSAIFNPDQLQPAELLPTFRTLIAGTTTLSELPRAAP
jgi:hypothetical protein